VSLAAVTLSLTLMLSGTKPDTYTERGLCDLWAGAQCYATSCMKDAKERCTLVSRRCRNATRQTVPQERAEKTANCAKALLKNSCGGPAPSECSDVSPP
jgi:hypothetical protein